MNCNEQTICVTTTFHVRCIWGEPEQAPHWSVVDVYVRASRCVWNVKKNPIEKPFKFCISASVTLCAECEQKNPIEKPFKFCIRASVTLCAECEQKNPIEKPFKFCIHASVTLCAECEQKNLIEKPFKFCIRASVTLCAECERYTGYSMNKAFVICAHHTWQYYARVM